VGEQGCTTVEGEAVARQQHKSFRDNPFLSFAPWILFWVIAGPSTWEVACVSALIAAVLLLILDIEPPYIGDRLVDAASGVRGSGRTRLGLKAPKTLDIGTVVFFALFSILGIFLARPDLIQLEQYSQAIGSGGLAVIVLTSLVVGHPFTEQYAREQTPEEYWDTPTFRRTNNIITAVWGLIFVVSAVLGFIAGRSSSNSLHDWFYWYIPIILLVLGFRFTSWYPAQVHARTEALRRQP
jgi:hypothetical protein